MAKEMLTQGVRSVINSSYRLGSKYISKKWQSETLPPITDPLLLMSATELAKNIREKQLKSEHLVQSFINRICLINHDINAMAVDIFHEALTRARDMDEALVKGDVNVDKLSQEKPFYGVPFSVKITFGIKGKPQNAGYEILKNNIAKDNSTAVQSMINGGAIPLCLTNCSEMSLWWECFNKTYGKTRNPHDLNRSAGGSSGGEGSLIAACGSPMGIGGDMSGSVRIPAYFNGIFAHKPTPGTIPHKDLVPIIPERVENYFSVGPLAKRAVDLLPMMKLLNTVKSHKLPLDTPVPPEGLKYYYVVPKISHRMVSQLDPEVLSSFELFIQEFEFYNKTSVKKLEIPELDFATEIFSQVMYEATENNITDLLGRYEGTVNRRAETIRWLLRKSDHTWPIILLMLAEARTKDNRTTKHFIRSYEILMDKLNSKLGDSGVMFTIPHPTPALYHHQSLLSPLNFVYTGIYSVLGLPATQCPTNMVSDRRPLGVQVVAAKDNDHLTLRTAELIERFFLGWRSPCEIYT